jgi:hypothetical protein
MKKYVFLRYGIFIRVFNESILELFYSSKIEKQKGQFERTFPKFKDNAVY